MTKELLQQAINASRTEVGLQMSLHQFSIEVSQLHEEHGNSQQYDDMLGVKTEQFFNDHLKALAQQDQPNRWSEAVIDQLVVHHIYQAVHDTDPRKAVNDLLCMSNSIALDPQVSSDAQALIDRGRREAQQEHPASVDAYVGAREDAAIWKKRALEAEELNRKFIADVNGPTHLGEPVKQEQPAQEPARTGDTLEDSVLYLLEKCPYSVRDVSGERTGVRGREDLAGSLAITFLGMQHRLQGMDKAPTQPALSDEQALLIAQATGAFDDLSLNYETGKVIATVKAVIEAHCRGGANHG